MLAVSLAAAIVLAGACDTSGQNAEEPRAAARPATVTLSRDGCTLTGPGNARAGMVRVHAVNRTSDQFDVDLWMLHEGHAYQELADHIAQEQQNFENNDPPLGHPTFATLVAEATVQLEGSAEVTADLEAGTYGFACIRFEEGAPVEILAVGPFTISA